MSDRQGSGVHRSSEPFYWSLFSAGGVISALLAPVLIIVVGFLVPGNEVSFHRLHEVFTNPFGRLALFGLAFFTFFLCAHRLRHTLTEVGLKHYATPITVTCNLAALAGAIWAGVVAFT
jgi:fumarate reductase subunit D